MSTSARAVARALFAATALVAIALTPTATGVSQAGGMRASGGAVRSSGSLGARRGLGAPGVSAAARGARVRATAGGIAVRSTTSNGHLTPPLNFAVRPLAPGTVIVPFSSPFITIGSPFLPFTRFFSGSVISPLFPGTVVNPLFPGTIFVPLFPSTGFVTGFTGTVFVPIFPNVIVTPVFQGTTIVTFPSGIIGVTTVPSLITPLPPGIVPPLVPQFIVLPLQKPLVSGPGNDDPQSASGGTGVGLTAGQLQMHRAAGSAVKSGGAPARSASPVRTSAGVVQPAPQKQTSEARALQEWVRTQNVGVRATRVARGASAQPAAEERSSAGTPSAKSGRGSAAVESAFGRPAHAVAFVPRTVFFRDFFAISDGRLGFKQFQHHPVVTTDVYYPGYVNDPSWFAFGHPGDYPSVYALWGWTPPWVAANRVSVLPANGLGGPSYPDPSEFTDNVDVVGAVKCIDGIRSAWLTGDPQRLAPYLSRQQDVRVYFNGKYEYSTSAADYYGMTVDAIAATRTTTLALDNPVWFATGDVVVTGRNAFRGPDGNLKTVYVSYRVKKLGNGWRITDFGSSLEPMESDGREFFS